MAIFVPRNPPKSWKFVIKAAKFHEVYTIVWSLYWILSYVLQVKWFNSITTLIEFIEIRCTRKKRARKNISKPFFGKNVDFTQYLPSFHIEIVIKMYGNRNIRHNSIIQACFTHKIRRIIERNEIIHKFTTFSPLEIEFHANLNFVPRWNFSISGWKPSESS